MGNMVTTYTAIGILVVIIASYTIVASAELHTCSVHTDSGSLRGKVTTVPYGRRVQQYLGIPYALPPVGKLRFSRSQPVRAWKGVRDAVEYGPDCPQVIMPWPVNWTEVGIQSEDCLHLNIYVPVSLHGAPTRSNLAVMVWIHGGGFISESGRVYDGSVLAALNDVIVVTLNYRLGLLGFFNIPGSDFPGNNGLFDQLLALKWVNENIAQFGGDRNRITIFGHSMGARSTAILTLSPLARGLFKRAIVMSGAPVANMFCHCNYNNDTRPLSIITKQMNCTSKNNADIVECMRKKTVAQIIEAQKLVTFPVYNGNPVLASVVVDGELVTFPPKIMLETGEFSHLEIMTGLTEAESSLIPANLLQNYAINGIPRPLFESIIRNTQFSKTNNENIQEAVLYKYTNHLDPDSPIANRDNWISWISDGMTTAPTLNMASIYYHGNASVYFYVFTHLSKYGIFPKYVGAVHGAEISYVFGAPFKPIKTQIMTTGFTNLEKGLSLYVMQLWTNFAKHGNPNVDETSSWHEVTWPQYSHISSAYLDISLDTKVSHHYKADRVAFWNQLVVKLQETGECS